jgi:PadR family transcriptional regulator, regulatory protein PadR
VYSPFLNRREPLTKPVELPQGTLEMLVLKAVSLGPLHGYGILLRIQQISGERLEILQGSFYTAIYRLERRGWIKGKWGESENNRRARFYSLTAARMCCGLPRVSRWSARPRAWSSVLPLTAFSAPSSPTGCKAPLPLVVSSQLPRSSLSAHSSPACCQHATPSASHPLKLSGMNKAYPI